MSSRDFRNTTAAMAVAMTLAVPICAQAAGALREVRDPVTGEMRGIGWELVAAQKSAARHAGGREHVFSDVLLIGLATDAFDDFAEHDVTAIAVFFTLAGREHRRLRGDEFIVGVIVGEAALRCIAECRAEDVGYTAMVGDELLYGRRA